MYRVTKILRFCYGHRLLDYVGPCQFLHGHNARVEIELTRRALDRRGMVTDFLRVKQRLQGWIDAELDHKMLLNRRDPLLKMFRQMRQPAVPIPGNPTAERLARLIFDQARRLRFPVTRVRFWETETSFATYFANRRPKSA